MGATELNTYGQVLLVIQLKSTASVNMFVCPNNMLQLFKVPLVKSLSDFIFSRYRKGKQGKHETLLFLEQKEMLSFFPQGLKIDELVLPILLLHFIT